MLPGCPLHQRPSRRKTSPVRRSRLGVFHADKPPSQKDSLGRSENLVESADDETPARKASWGSIYLSRHRPRVDCQLPGQLQTGPAAASALIILDCPHTGV